MQYCESIFKTKRRQTREVFVGSVGVGGHHPIRIQSMTTSNTRDVEATVDQIIRLADRGCEIVRMTVQGIKEADACESIKNKLLQKGYSVPLVADIHFFPPAALRVTDFVDKVRINPGNFVDKRATFKVIDYDDDSYAKELEKIEEKFTPLVEKCKRLKRAMRIGTNHGSLSDRIMNRYGDTPRGMVESALEFARICRQNDYHDLIFSMKASNPQVMIQAYRLLVAEMMALGWDYPLHLGVTEAGQGEDGRVKSAMGIGSLLLDGLGDTIRVSLTEDPWLEIDPCQRLIHFAQAYEGKGVSPFVEDYRSITEVKRRSISYPKQVALHRDGTVVLSVADAHTRDPQFYKNMGCEGRLGQPKLRASSADMLVVEDALATELPSKKIQALQEIGVGIASKQPLENGLHLLSFKEARAHQRPFALPLTTLAAQPIGLIVKDEPCQEWSLIQSLQPAVIFLRPSDHRLHYARQFFNWLQQEQISIPVILNFTYTGSFADITIQAAAECGALLCDSLGEGVFIEAPHEDIDSIRQLSFNILQAARMRTSKTDFISCPSCGRTLFDLQDVTKRIRSRTSHLPGVKIAIMGCIVNGPGEMADADFGYVGSKPGMIDLYVGKECVEKDIPFSEADDRLIALIKTYNRWQDPEVISD
jgi:(E)-4-hydroxy-3-methylbut-2-enyl-diphosphate synthase